MAAFRLNHLFRMGMLAYVAAYLWLSIPALLFTSLEDVTSKWQVAVLLTGCLGMAVTLSWLPALLAHVAAEGRWRAIVEIGRVKNMLAAAPFKWAFANALLLACSSLPLLYAALFKTRIPPHSARWDLMLVFFVTVTPARIFVSWVYHRAAQQVAIRADEHPAWAATWVTRIWQGIHAMALLIGVAYYVYFLNLASTGGELGDRSVWQFHAVLLPFPFWN